MLAASSCYTRVLWCDYRQPMLCMWKNVQEFFFQEVEKVAIIKESYMEGPYCLIFLPKFLFFFYAMLI